MSLLCAFLFLGFTNAHEPLVFKRGANINEQPVVQGVNTPIWTPSSPKPRGAYKFQPLPNEEEFYNYSAKSDFVTIDTKTFTQNQWEHRNFQKCTISVSGSTFEFCKAMGFGLSYGSGGGIYAHRSSVTVFSTFFTSCDATIGGAISLTKSAFIGAKLNISGCNAYLLGGGIFMSALQLYKSEDMKLDAPWQYYSVSLMNSGIVACKSMEFYGGAVFANISQVTISHVDFYNNVAVKGASALGLINSPLRLSFSRFKWNVCGYQALKTEINPKTGQTFHQFVSAMGGGAIYFNIPVKDTLHISDSRSTSDIPSGDFVYTDPDGVPLADPPKEDLPSIYTEMNCFSDNRASPRSVYTYSDWLIEANGKNVEWQAFEDVYAGLNDRVIGKTDQTALTALFGSVIFNHTSNTDAINVRCQFRDRPPPTPTSHFTASEEFTPSLTFAPQTEGFTASAAFTGEIPDPTRPFTASAWISPTAQFTDTPMTPPPPPTKPPGFETPVIHTATPNPVSYTLPPLYTRTFTSSARFTATGHFSPTVSFTTSGTFSATSLFSTSYQFTSSDVFTESFTASTPFSPSTQFSASHSFTTSFTATSGFTASQEFSSSADFTSSLDFSATEGFTSTAAFTATTTFTATVAFTESSIFTDSGAFTQSIDFTPSTKFTGTGSFTATTTFTATSGFTASSGFTQSSKFTQSNYFTASAKFTGTGSFTATTTFTATSAFTASSIFTDSHAFTDSETFLSVQDTNKETITVSVIKSATLTVKPVLSHSLTRVISMSAVKTNIDGKESFTYTKIVFEETYIQVTSYQPLSFFTFFSKLVISSIPPANQESGTGMTTTVLVSIIGGVILAAALIGLAIWFFFPAPADDESSSLDDIEMPTETVTHMTDSSAPITQENPLWPNNDDEDSDEAFHQEFEPNMDEEEEEEEEE